MVTKESGPRIRPHSCRVVLHFRSRLSLRSLWTVAVEHCEPVQLLSVLASVQIVVVGELAMCLEGSCCGNARAFERRSAVSREPSSVSDSSGVSSLDRQRSCSYRLERRGGEPLGDCDRVRRAIVAIVADVDIAGTIEEVFRYCKNLYGEG